jgi:hypothetical protein
MSQSSSNQRMEEDFLRHKPLHDCYWAASGRCSSQPAVLLAPLPQLVCSPCMSRCAVAEWKSLSLESIADHPETLKAFLDLCEVLLSRCSPILFAMTTLLPFIVQIAIACCTFPSRDLVRSVAQFMTSLRVLVDSDSGCQYKPTIATVFVANCELK